MIKLGYKKTPLGLNIDLSVMAEDFGMLEKATIADHSGEMGALYFSLAHKLGMKNIAPKVYQFSRSKDYIIRVGTDTPQDEQSLIKYIDESRKSTYSGLTLKSWAFSDEEVLLYFQQLRRNTE